MLTVSMSVKGSTRYPACSMLLQICVCLLVLLGTVARYPVEGQSLWSPCPKVFSNTFDIDSNQWVGYIQLQGIRVGELVKLDVDLSIGIAVPDNNVGSITLAKSSEQTFRDIENNQTVQYRVDFLLNNVIPSVLTIAMNGQTICTGAEGVGKVTSTFSLEHTLLTQLLPVANDGNENSSKIVLNENMKQFQQSQTPASTIPNIPLFPKVPFKSLKDLVREPISIILAPEELKPAIQSSAADDVECVTAVPDIFRQREHFPWVSAIFNIDMFKMEYICSSNIITKRHLVTAAYCMFDAHGVKRNPNTLWTMPGMHDSDIYLDTYQQDRKVESIFIHEDYYFEVKGLTDSDIAVIQVDKQIEFNNLARPICLLPENYNVQEIAGFNGHVAGWSIIDNGTTIYPSYAETTVINSRFCSCDDQKLIGTSSKEFCTNEPGSEPLNGYSGTGIVIRRGTSYFLLGVLSYRQIDLIGRTCARDKYVAYTDITKNWSWLSNFLKRNTE